MGWGRTLLLGDIGNRLDIADTERDIEELRNRLYRKDDLDLDQDQRIRQLSAEVEDLELYLASLLRLLVKKKVLTKKELELFVSVIDPDA